MNGSILIEARQEKKQGGGGEQQVDKLEEMAGVSRNDEDRQKLA